MGHQNRARDIMFAVESVVRRNDICCRIEREDPIEACVDAVQCRERLITLGRP